MEREEVKGKATVKRRKVSLKLPMGKQRESQESSSKQLYKVVHRHLANTVTMSTPACFQNMWKREKIGSRFIVGPYHWGHNQIVFTSDILEEISDILKMEEQNTNSFKCNIRTIKSSMIELVNKNNDAISSKKSLNSELSLRFGIHGCTPAEIISQAEEKVNYLTKSEFISLLLNHIKSNTQINFKDKLTDQLLDFSDFDNDSHFDLKKSNKILSKILHVLDIISLSCMYSSVAFEVFPLAKLKIGCTALSQLLINKPTNHDENNRLLPYTQSSVLKRPVVGVWVYGLDHPDYKVDRDYNPTQISMTNNQLNKEDTKAQLCISPFLWSALIKFYLDVNIHQRVSVSSKCNSFVIVHFFNASSNPQFLEFKIINKPSSGGESSNGNNVPGSVDNSSSFQYALSLNDQDYMECSQIRADQISKMKASLLKSQENIFTSKNVKKCVKDILKRKARGDRSNSKNSISSNRISLNTISSVGKLGGTIDASRDSFKNFDNISIERNICIPGTQNLKVSIENQENISSNIIIDRTRNITAVNSFSVKNSTRNQTNSKMIKSNTLSKLQKTSAIDLNKQSISISNRNSQSCLSNTINK